MSNSWKDSTGITDKWQSVGAFDIWARGEYAKSEKEEVEAQCPRGDFAGGRSHEARVQPLRSQKLF